MGLPSDKQMARGPQELTRLSPGWRSGNGEDRHCGANRANASRRGYVYVKPLTLTRHSGLLPFLPTWLGIDALAADVRRAACHGIGQPLPAIPGSAQIAAVR